jgi:osmotically inducible lipoprotein OsmB
LLTVSSTSTGHNAQKGTAIGAAVGAQASQAIGNNTASTLIGAAGGALGGAIVGNAIDQGEVERRLEDAQRQPAVTAPASPEEQLPRKMGRNSRTMEQREVGACSSRLGASQS